MSAIIKHCNLLTPRESVGHLRERRWWWWWRGFWGILGKHWRWWRHSTGRDFVKYIFTFLSPSPVTSFVSQYIWWGPGSVVIINCEPGEHDLACRDSSSSFPHLLPSSNLNICFLSLLCCSLSRSHLR